MTYTTPDTLPAPHLAPDGPRLSTDRHTGTTFTPATGKLAGRRVTYGKRLYGTGMVIVTVDGSRLAWAVGAALRAQMARDGAARA